MTRVALSGALFFSPVGAAGRTYLIRVNPRQSVAKCFLRPSAVCLLPYARATPATPDSVYNSDTAPPTAAASPLSRRSHPVRRRIPPLKHRPSEAPSHLSPVHCPLSPPRFARPQPPLPSPSSASMKQSASASGSAWSSPHLRPRQVAWLGSALLHAPYPQPHAPSHAPCSMLHAPSPASPHSASPRPPFPPVAESFAPSPSRMD